MKPSVPNKGPQEDLFRHRLEIVTLTRRPLVRLSGSIDWEHLDTLLKEFFEEAAVGQPPKQTRLMYLKHTYRLSDEALVKQSMESRILRYFYGETYFQHEPRILLTTLIRYPHRLKQADCGELLRMTSEAGHTEAVIRPQDIARVVVGTNVMDKATTYPTDDKLYLKSLFRLDRQAKHYGGVLRQIHTRTAKQPTVKAGQRYAHAKQFRHMRMALKQSERRLGRVTRDIARKTAGWASIPHTLAHELQLAKQLLTQKPTSNNKLYSPHAPEVERISTGKAYKRYSSSAKNGIVASLKTPFILATHALSNNPYDGNTPPRSLTNTKINTGVPINTAVVDKGCRSHLRAWARVNFILPCQRSQIEPRPQERCQQLRRRSVIDSLIGHMKTNGLLDLNWLKGRLGDAMHVVLCAAGQNPRLTLCCLRAFNPLDSGADTASANSVIEEHPLAPFHKPIESGITSIKPWPVCMCRPSLLLSSI